MDDFRISSLGFNDSMGGQTNDESKEQSKHRHFEPPPEIVDEVALSAGDIEEQPLGYLPAAPNKEPE